jgi:chromosome partitioning protein
MEYEGASDAASRYLDLAHEVVERSRIATAA